jgi:hypothetical protein
MTAAEMNPKAANTMLRNTKQLRGFAIRATDGELGVIDQLYFDDETWAVRYLGVDTGTWLSGRQVLISPISIIHTDWLAKLVYVSLTKQQVEHSPDINTHLPVSRQHEAATLGYYGYSRYWVGPYLWGPSSYPDEMAIDPAEVASDFVSRQSQDSHLRTTDGVMGYNIDAEDGDIGHLDGFVMDDETWSLRYVEVATRNWWPGKKVLVSPAWIEKVSWTSPKLYVGLLKKVIESAPEYIESIAITREYESQLYFHYGRPPYWPNDVAHMESLSLRDA